MARAEKRQQRWLEAVRQGKTEDVSRMIAEGADVLAKNNGETVLHLAVEMGHTGVVTMLLNARADVAATQKNKTRDFTPLQLAWASRRSSVKFREKQGSFPETLPSCNRQIVYWTHSVSGKHDPHDSLPHKSRPSFLSTVKSRTGHTRRDLSTVKSRTGHTRIWRTPKISQMQQSVSIAVLDGDLRPVLE